MLVKRQHVYVAGFLLAFVVLCVLTLRQISRLQSPKMRSQAQRQYSHQISSISEADPGEAPPTPALGKVMFRVAPSGNMTNVYRTNDVFTPGQVELNLIRKLGTTQRIGHLDLNNLTDQQLSFISHAYPDNNQVVCRRKLRMGHVGDGGWEVCDDEEVRLSPPCIVYSFGIMHDFSFDDSIAQWYKCHVFSFDPTTDMSDHNRSERVHFYKLGIASSSRTNEKSESYSTLGEIRTALHHESSRLSMVKMDVEGDELLTIPQMLRSGFFNDVSQFLVEYHIKWTNRTMLLLYTQAMQSLELAGFRIFYTHKNEGCGFLLDHYGPITATCFEVHYLRMMEKLD